MARRIATASSTISSPTPTSTATTSTSEPRPTPAAARVVPISTPSTPSAPALPALPAVTLGWVVGCEQGSGPLVDFPGSPHGPTPARLLAALTLPALQAAAAARQPVALVFERGDPTLPLITGLVQSPSPSSTSSEARIDGKRVVITGEEEVELRCGEASITLNKSGKLVIRGAYVETRAKGTNRIKGGSVQIN